MKAKDFMIKDVISLNEEATIKTLLEVLMKHKIGGLPLVDPNNKLLGIVTDGDVLRYMNPKAFISSYVTYIEELDETLKSKSESPVKAIMKKKVVFVREEDELEDEDGVADVVENLRDDAVGRSDKKDEVTF